MGITDKDKLVLKKQEQDDIGMTHYRYQQTYEGIVVEGGEFLLHEKNGSLQTANGNFYDNLNINVKPTISEQNALENAMRNVGAEKWMWENPDAERFLKRTTEDPLATYFPKAELVILPFEEITDNVIYKLCYKINISAEEPYTNYDVYVDAHTGEIIKKINKLCNAIETGTAETLYSGTRSIITDSSDGIFRLRDYTRGKGVETYDSRNKITYLDAEGFRRRRQ